MSCVEIVSVWACVCVCVCVCVCGEYVCIVSVYVSYVCMYGQYVGMVSMCVCMRVRMVSMHAWPACKSVCICARMLAFVYVGKVGMYERVYFQEYVCMHSCMYVSIRVCVHLNTYLHS